MRSHCIVAAASCVLALGACRASQPRKTAPQALAVPSVAASFPNFVLTDQLGTKVRFFDDLVHGRSVVIQFMYTSCDGV